MSTITSVAGPLRGATDRARVASRRLDPLRTDRAALPGHLVRFSIGLEAVADLQADLAQALARMG